MLKLAGISARDRERLTILLRSTDQAISLEETARILNLSNPNASKLLSRWAAKGWVSRVKQGLYIPVSLESTTADIPLENPWVIAQKLYSPCYVGAWNAAEHWGLTEQLFRTIAIFTTQKIKNHQPIIKDTHFSLYTISPHTLFGLKPIWQGKSKVMMSDPTRTLLDLLISPKLGGGIRPTTDIFKEYLKSEHKNMALLIDYAIKLNNSAVFKRLGFLLEEYAPEELNSIENCKKYVTISKTKLDPQLETGKLITKWRLWLPKHWIK